MSSADTGPRGPIAALVSRWWLGVILVLVGAVAGFGIASQIQTHYTAEARLIVGADDLSSYQVAGFATAAQQLASNYSRYVDNSSTLSSSLRRDLGSRDDQLIQISASPIPQSSVVSIQTVATDRSTSVAAAQSIAQSLVRLTAALPANGPEALLKSYRAIAERAGAADTLATTLTDRLQQAMDDKKPTGDLKDQLATAKVQAQTLDLERTAAGLQYEGAVTQPASESALNLLQSASIVSDNHSQTQEMYVAGGAIAGLVAALTLAALLERRRTSAIRLAAPSDEPTPAA